MVSYAQYIKENRSFGFSGTHNRTLKELSPVKNEKIKKLPQIFKDLTEKVIGDSDYATDVRALKKHIVRVINQHTNGDCPRRIKNKNFRPFGRIVWHLLKKREDIPARELYNIAQHAENIIEKSQRPMLSQDPKPSYFNWPSRFR